MTVNPSRLAFEGSFGYETPYKHTSKKYKCINLGKALAYVPIIGQIAYGLYFLTVLVFAKCPPRGQPKRSLKDLFADHHGRATFGRVVVVLQVLAPCFPSWTWQPQSCFIKT